MVSALCRQYDGFLILDEIQTGLGRLGEWWGADVDGVVPDMLLTGKALGGGVLPVSAAVANRTVFSPFDKDPYVHTATFSGAPVLMAAVSGAIGRMKEDDWSVGPRSWAQSCCRRSSGSPGATAVNWSSRYAGSGC